MALRLWGARVPTSQQPDHRSDDRATADRLALQGMAESLQELEHEISQRGWSRVAAAAEMELSRSGLGDIVSMARVMVLKDPLIARAVSVQGDYVFGRGVSIHAADPDLNQVVQDYLDDWGNLAELTSHEAMLANDRALQTDGNIFFVHFVDPVSGAVATRSILFDEVTDVICNPADRSDPWFWRRDWTMSPQGLARSNGASGYRHLSRWYPDWRLPDAAPGGTTGAWPPAQIDGVEVEQSGRIQHMAVGGLKHMIWGVPPLLPAMDWATAYRGFLADGASTWRALNRFAWRMRGVKGRSEASLARQQLATAMTLDQPDTNPPAVTGSTFIGAGGVNLEAISKSGAAIKLEDARSLRTYVASAVGVPDNILGNDPQQGALATARTLDRPTELHFANRQKLWEQTLRATLEYAVQAATRSGRLPGRLVANAYGRRRIVLAGGRSAEIQITFPSITERDIAAQVGAIVSAATMGGQPLAGVLPRARMITMLLSALGETDIDAALAELSAETPPASQQESLVQVAEALGEFRRAVSQMSAMPPQ